MRAWGVSSCVPEALICVHRAPRCVNGVHMAACPGHLDVCTGIYGSVRGALRCVHGVYIVASPEYQDVCLGYT